MTRGENRFVRAVAEEVVRLLEERGRIALAGVPAQEVARCDVTKPKDCSTLF
jgi:hypothetical protein